ncbi:hypothetical protein JW707_02520 [Candidatus Woesearchaeota archaeon]|nr:hypothetical protein [Candidatus Woesearchaeota archaeon]
MKKTIVLVAFIALVLILSSCTQETKQAGDETLKDCVQYEGADYCAMFYKPVCGKLKEGGWKTFSNACTACISGETEGYKEGEC